MTLETDAHAELVQRDPSLPGLRLLFEPARLAQVLAAHSGVPLSSIVPLYIRYKRRTSCLVGYRVAGPQGFSHLYAKAFRPAADAKFEKGLTRGAVPTWLGPGPLLLRDSAVTVWAHPNDAKLPMLRHVADGEGRAVLLRRAPSDVKESASTPFRMLSYKPERRFVAEMRQGDPSARPAVLKMYTAGGYEEARARATGVTSREVLRVPNRLARDSRRHLLLFEWLPGRPAADLVASKEPLGVQLAFVGQALAELHAQPLKPSTPPCLSYDLETVGTVISEVEFLFPRLGGLLKRLRACLGDMSPELRHPVRPVHGDFHLRQVLLSTATVSFVDFDRAGGGPAVGDIAYCRAHLEREVLDGLLSRGRADDVMEEILSGYGRVRQRPCTSALDIYTAAALALLLPEPFRQCRPDAFDLTAGILDRALGLLTRAASTTALS